LPRISHGMLKLRPGQCFPCTVLAVHDLLRWSQLFLVCQSPEWIYHYCATLIVPLH
jgi:hypothetical protein